VEERLDIMEALLRWRHLAPTAPDTLPAIPLSEADPFIMTASPAVFFVGCQPSYGTRLVTGAQPLTVVVADQNPCTARRYAISLVNLQPVACRGHAADS
jgi:DNA polymerase II small subunit/DNA polymerase delta subunit B